MTSSIISVENLSKAYRIGLKEEAPDTLVQAATGRVGFAIRYEVLFHCLRLRAIHQLCKFGDSGTDCYEC